AYVVTNNGPWSGTVSDSFYPDTTAQRQIYQDALHPWKRNTTQHFKLALPVDGSRGRNVLTPLDGTLDVNLEGPPGNQFNLALTYGDTTLKRAVGPGSKKHLSFTVCGQRTV